MNINELETKNYKKKCDIWLNNLEIVFDYKDNFDILNNIKY
jgi:hypothetical protein